MTETATIHDAMTRAQGVRATAAAALGIEPSVLADKIRANADLAALWISRRGVTSVEDAYDRDRPELEVVDLGGAVSPRDIAVADGFMAQNVKVQKFDWEGVGITDPKTLDLMRKFETGVGRGVLRMMDAMQGGMAYCFGMVSRQFADTAGQLEVETAKSPEGVGTQKRDEQKIMLLHMRFMDLAREMQKFNKEATNAAHTRLLIADRARKLQQAGDRLRKPGWRKVTPTPQPNAQA